MAVLGAGFAGLTARPVTIERGAEFVLTGYERLTALCGRFGLTLAQTGMSYYIRETFEYPDITTGQPAAAGQRVAGMAGAPGESAGELLKRLEVDDDVRECLTARVEISAASAAGSVNASVLQNVSSFEEVPSWRISEGNQSLAYAMHRFLGGRVRLQTPVQAVRQTADGVRVVTADRTFDFDAMIVALPLGALTGGGVEIDMPAWKQQAFGKLTKGHAAKLHLLLDAAPDTSAIMSVHNRFWTRTVRRLGEAVPPVINCFAGSPSALDRMDVAQGPGTWAELVRKMRTDLDIADADPVLSTWADAPPGPRRLRRTRPRLAGHGSGTAAPARGRSVLRRRIRRGRVHRLDGRRPAQRRTRRPAARRPL
ncbi:FAD-dependent oxidoreductase [Arthrobacter sp. E918]|uniref:FAD-dependent oxidoreductase n=1 Tax=Arthrobacter mobilis TaxID=2724944 RepID=A0A7X6HE89_9MICC|nr:FAD-dependent oxidoreductase [Arthrobacter mobilis]NKX54381.1 FAD-dependent oxidoreductase [Arthrobacter mobilis]